MDLYPHPYGPAVRWRIAISRRFTDARVESIYAQHIRPTVSADAMVLECSYASDDAKDADYWVNRMRMIFGCSDLHLLIDLGRSGNVDHEFELSNRLAGKRARAMRATNSGICEILELPALAFLPIQIWVLKGRGKNRYSYFQRKAEVRLEPENALTYRLESALDWAKRHRRRELKEMKIYDFVQCRLAKLLNDFGPATTVQGVQVKMTEIASQFASGAAVHSIRIDSVDPPFPSLDVSTRAAPHVAVRNAMDKFDTDVKQGNIRLPTDGKAALQLVYLRTKDIWDDFSGGWSPMYIRAFIWVGALARTWRLRKYARTGSTQQI